MCTFYVLRYLLTLKVVSESHVTRTPLSNSKGQKVNLQGAGHIVAASRTSCLFCCPKCKQYKKQCLMSTVGFGLTVDAVISRNFAIFTNLCPDFGHFAVIFCCSCMHCLYHYLFSPMPPHKRIFETNDQPVVPKDTKQPSVIVSNRDHCDAYKS